MSYRVLARAYRSNTFDEIVGQDVIATTLRNAITAGRVHHGYLFAGTRGVGKTSMARILAKSLNCLATDAPTTEPCCKCDSCVAVAAGDDVDVVEIDAASNTGVDNIRDLRSNAMLRPARARFKIYIIDEVHMLSTGAFNALLKTLEEPPSHVRFILATTESQKVPATIKSRCQRFDFKTIEVSLIAEHLGSILEAEKIEAEDGVLRRIARLGNGSMRDALSLLDKVLAYRCEDLTMEVVDELLPPPHDAFAFALLECAAAGDAAGALEVLDNALQAGQTVDRFCDQLVQHIRTLMVLKICGPKSDLVDVSQQHRPALIEQADRFDPPTYVYMMAMFEELRRNVKFSGARRALADAAVVRLTMVRQFTDIHTLIDSLSDGAPAEVPSVRDGGGRARPADGNPTAFSAKAPAGQDPVEKSQVAKKAPPAPDEPRAQAASGARERATGPASPGGTSRARGAALVSTADWQRVANDPLIERVTRAVDGTLRDVRRIVRADDARPLEHSDEFDDGVE